MSHQLPTCLLPRSAIRISYSSRISKSSLPTFSTLSSPRPIVSRLPARTLTKPRTLKQLSPVASFQRGLASLREEGDHAVLSMFDLFSVGVGPSSSHTVGPMRAGHAFITSLQTTHPTMLDQVSIMKVKLYGSLSATGRGHMTPEAVLMGLEGELPESVEAESIPSRFETIVKEGVLNLGGKKKVAFDYVKDLTWSNHPLPRHPNALTLTAFNKDGDMLANGVYYSVGGGFVEGDGVDFGKSVQPASSKFDTQSELDSPGIMPPTPPRWPFATAEELLRMCSSAEGSIADIVIQNELVWRSKQDVQVQMDQIWQAMDDSIAAGISSKDKILPGGLQLRRRAPRLHQMFLESKADPGPRKGLSMQLFPGIDLLSCYAIAVNETNAAGGRVVTAPTNGAAGVIPAVLKYYLGTTTDDKQEVVQKFLATSAAIGMLCKKNASISAAEGGCMSEVGVSTSMAAGGLTACLGGSPAKVLEAAEIAMEHSLGMTCDPINGLVQVPCIERNSLGAVKAVTAAQLALAGQGDPSVSFDTVVEAMRETARDMHMHYKETSMGGLATTYVPPVTLPQC